MLQRGPCEHSRSSREGVCSGGVTSGMPANLPKSGTAAGRNVGCGQADVPNACPGAERTWGPLTPPSSEPFPLQSPCGPCPREPWPRGDGHSKPAAPVGFQPRCAHPRHRASSRAVSRLRKRVIARRLRSAARLLAAEPSLLGFVHVASLVTTGFISPCLWHLCTPAQGRPRPVPSRCTWAVSRSPCKNAVTVSLGMPPAASSHLGTGVCACRAGFPHSMAVPGALAAGAHTLVALRVCGRLTAPAPPDSC